MHYGRFLIAVAINSGIGFGVFAPLPVPGLDRVLPVAEAQAQAPPIIEPQFFKPVDAWLASRPRDGIAPNSSTRPTLDPPPIAPTGPPGILPDGSKARCTLGPGRMRIGADGQVVFPQLFSQQSGREFGKNGCEDVVSYPKAEETDGN